MSRVVKAHLALLGVNLIYGANYSIVKAIVPMHIQPFALVAIRASCCALLFWFTSLFLPKEKIAKKDFIKLLLLGVFGVALNQLLFIKGLAMSTPINAAIIMIFNPVIVMLLEIIFLKEKAPFIRVAGIMAGILGALILLLGRKDISFSSSSFTGDILVLINCTSWAVYLVMAKPLLVKYRTVTIVKWVFSFGMVYVFPFGLPQLKTFDAHSASIMVWLCIGYVVMASTYLAYFLNTFALSQLTPSIASTYIYLQPVIAAAIAIYAGQDTINAVKIMAALLIITGIYLVSLSRKKAKEKITSTVTENMRAD